MSKKAKLLMKIMNRAQANNVTFSELCGLVELLGFVLKNVTGSHHIYVKDAIKEIINLQPGKNGKAKAYQVEEVRALIIEKDLK